MASAIEVLTKVNKTLEAELSQVRADNDVLRAQLEQLETQIANQAPDASATTTPLLTGAAGVLAVLARVEDRARVNAIHASGGVLDQLDIAREMIMKGVRDVDEGNVSEADHAQGDARVQTRQPAFRFEDRA